MRVIFTITLMLYEILCFGQQEEVYEFSKKDSVQYQLAKNFIASELGEYFLNDTLEFSGIYQSVLRMFAFEIRTEFCTNQDRNMILIFMDGDRIETKYNTKINRNNLTNYFSKDSTENIFINRKFALEKAKSEGLNKGIKKWKVELSGVADSVWWKILSIDKEESEPPYSAGGQSFKLNIRNGKFKLGRWVEIE